MVSGIVVVLLVMVVLVLLLGFPLMWLWNAVMPDIFNLPTITFWQAVGLNLISMILFKTSHSTSKQS